MGFKRHPLVLHGAESLTAPACGAGWFEDEPVFTAGNEGGALLDIRFEHSEQLWPWSGFLALYVRVRDAGVTFSGQARRLHLPPPCRIRVRVGLRWDLGQELALAHVRLPGLALVRLPGAVCARARRRRHVFRPGAPVASTTNIVAFALVPCLPFARCNSSLSERVASGKTSPEQSIARQAAGEVAFTIVSPPVKGETAQRRSLVRLPIILDIIPTPPR